MYGLMSETTGTPLVHTTLFVRSDGATETAMARVAFSAAVVLVIAIATAFRTLKIAFGVV